MTDAVVLTEAGELVVRVVAIIAALGFLSRLRPTKWLVRTLIAEPMSGWFRAEVTAARQEQDDLMDARLNSIEHELGRNGGYSLKDKVERIEDKVNVLMKRPAP